MTDQATPDKVRLTDGLGPLADSEEDPARLWSEIHRLRAAVQGPDGYATWQDAATALRSADHLRKAIKAEAEVALLRAALNGGNVIERLQFALQRLADATEALGVNNFGEDWRSDEVQELQAATHAARLVLGPNARLTGPKRPPQEYANGTD